MKLCDIIEQVEYKNITGDMKTEIRGISTDSRKVKRGELFVCYAGTNFDSHSRVDEAEKNGAAALVCEKAVESKLPQIIVENGRKQIAKLARAFYGYADKKLKIIGVTGTNGKTTTTHMLAEIFKAEGYSVGVIGTLGISYGEKFIAPELTTPDPIYLHSVFADMAERGVQYVFMEVSAHAIRLKGCTLKLVYLQTARRTTSIFLAV